MLTEHRFSQDDLVLRYGAEVHSWIDRAAFPHPGEDGAWSKVDLDVWEEWSKVTPLSVAELPPPDEGLPESPPPESSPLPVTQPLPAPAEYPLAALGPLADVVCEVSEGAQVTLPVVGNSLLISAALMVQGRYNLESLGGGIVPLSLYGLTVVQSGDGKGAADRIGLARVCVPVSWYDRLLGRRRPVIGAEIHADRSSVSRGVFSNEAGVRLSDYRRNAEWLCGLWDDGRGADYRAARLSMHLLAKPDGLRKLVLDDRLSGLGLWARFLVAHPEPLVPRRYQPWRAEDSLAVRDYWRRGDELLSVPVPKRCSDLPVIRLDADARLVLAEFYSRMEGLGRGGAAGLGLMRQHILLAPELVCRVAGVLAAWRGSVEVDRLLAYAAIELVSQSLGTWLRVLMR